MQSLRNHQMTSASGRVFSVPELASMVFAFGDQATLAACALVRRLWREPALDELWKHLDSISPLLGLLPDVGTQEPTKPVEHFVRMMQGVDWITFRSYAQRVRTLDIKPTPESPFHFKTTFIVAASTSHPFGTSLLPHVRRLRWDPFCCSECLLIITAFVSPSVVELELGLEFLGEAEATALFLSLQDYTPNIQELAIRLSDTVQVDFMQDYLSQWISSLRHLTRLWLPPQYLSKAIVAAAGELRELRELKMMTSGMVADSETGWEMEFRRDTFPQLRTLEWTATLPSAFQLLQPSPQVEALESLYLNCVGYDTQVDVPSFTGLVGCEEASDGPLDSDVLYGLAPCRKLISLRIGHPFPLMLDESDVHWIGTTWKEMESLVLCVDPDLNRTIQPWMGTPISTLPLLAKLLPNLNHLGLYFRENGGMRFSGDLHPQYQFKNFRTLQVGFSSVPGGETEDLAFLLASLCGPRPPSIDATRPAWHPRRWEGLRSSDPRSAQWIQVSRIMGMAIRTKVFECNRRGQTVG